MKTRAEAVIESTDYLSTERHGQMNKDEWFRVEVSDHEGQIVAIESEMLAGRDIGEIERGTICRAIRHLRAFIGLPAPRPEQESETPSLPRMSALEIQDFFEHVEQWIAYGVDHDASTTGAEGMCGTTKRVQAHVEQLERELSALTARERDALDAKRYRRLRQLNASPLHVYNCEKDANLSLYGDDLDAEVDALPEATE